MSFLDELPKPFLALAPMDDVTDTVFRQIVAECAPPDLYFTEFVNVDGLQSAGREKLLPKLQFSRKEQPIIAQLWGINPENFYKVTKEVIGMGFDGVDLNMGCPVKKVVKGGACAAMINHRELAAEIIDAVIEAVESVNPRSTQVGITQGESAERTEAYREVRRMSTVNSQRSGIPASTGGVAGSAGKQAKAVRVSRDFPVSVKTRVGFNTTDMTWPEFLLSKKLDLLSIHGRTAKQMSNVPANWDLVGEVRKMRDVLCPSTKIVGNGDVESRGQAEKLAKKYQLDGVMVGRGIFHDPFLFADKSPWGSYSREQKIALFKKHIQLFAKTWQHGEYRFDALKKFCKVYINGFDGAAELRAEFMTAKNAKEGLDILDGSSQD